MSSKPTAEAIEPEQETKSKLPSEEKLAQMKEEVMARGTTVARVEKEKEVEALDLASIDDLFFAGELKDYTSERMPNFPLVIRDNIKWDTDDVPEEYLTNKKIMFKRLTIKEQEEISGLVARLSKRDKHRAPSGVDYNETAVMITKAVLPEMSLKQVKELKLVPFLWFSYHLLKAQGIGEESFEELKNGLLSQESE